MNGPEILVPLGGMVMIVVLALGFPMIRLLHKRLDAQTSTPLPPSDTTARLERIEHAIDAMSVEVERIAEGQRFTTKLLSERAGAGDGQARVTRGAEGR
jgi:hypothetical protein